MSKRAAVYCRISQDREGAGLGVERQRADCEALARKLGWSIVASHTDNDLSAYSGKPRPGYRALLDDLDTGRADAVLVWHTDRLHRSPRELEEYVDLCERRKVVTQTVQAGELDLATPSGRAVARTLGAWARFEVEHKSERTKRAQAQAAAAGKWLGGAPPFGWTLHGPEVTPTINPAEAREIREASKALLAGMSLGSIVADLNSRGVTTSTGRHWNYTSLRQVLTRARNAGLTEYNGEIVGQSVMPPIVSEDTWRGVCAVLGDPDRRKSQSNRIKWLLAGLAVCGTCGSPMRSATARSSRPGGPSRTVYRCRRGQGGGHVARAAAALDEYVSALVVARLSQPDAAEAMAKWATGSGEADSRHLDAVALRQRLTEAADAFADGAITAAQLTRITEGIRSRLADVEAELAHTDRSQLLADFVGNVDAQTVWGLLSVERRRAVVQALMMITVMPGMRGREFDPALVCIEWRNAT